MENSLFKHLHEVDSALASEESNEGISSSENKAISDSQDPHSIALERAKAYKKDPDLQRQLVALQRQKKGIEAALQVDLQRIEMGLDLESADGADFIEYDEQALSLTVQTVEGKKQLVQLGEVMANIGWGQKYVTSSVVPTDLREKIARGIANQEIASLTNDQIYLDATSAPWLSDDLRNAYEGKYESEKGGEIRLGHLAEKVVSSLFTRLQYDAGLGFTVTEADLYDDIVLKVDFIIEAAESARGVQTKLSKEKGAMGVQFTLQNDNGLQRKQEQLRHAKAELPYSSTGLRDVVLVSVSPQVATAIRQAYAQYTANPVHSIDTYLPLDVQKELFSNVLSGVYSDEEITEAWRGVEEYYEDLGEAVQQTQEIPGDGEKRETREDMLRAVGEKLLFTTERFAKEQGQYYHNAEHARRVEKRAQRILKALHGNQTDTEEYKAERELLSLAAYGHDAVQVFLEQQKGKPRGRKFGESEALSMNVILDLLQELPSGVLPENAEDILAEALECTKAQFHAEKGIFQPDVTENTSRVARAIALADLGGLGMEGAYVFSEESTRVFLEENPDFIAEIADFDGEGILRISLDSIDEARKEELADRLRRSVTFDILFANTRWSNFEGELEGLSDPQKNAVKQLFSDFEDQVALATEIREERMAMSFNELILSYDFESIIGEYAVPGLHSKARWQERGE